MRAATPLVLYLVSVLLGWSLLEGAGFFNLVAYLLEGSVISLVVTLCISAGMLLLFPTKGRFAFWSPRERPSD